MFVAYRGMIWFIEMFFKTHKEPRFKLANLLWEQKKRLSSLRDFRDPAYLGGATLNGDYRVFIACLSDIVVLGPCLRGGQPRPTE